jgi:hypothetical protein
MRAVVALALAALLAASAGCASTGVNTQVLVIIEAEPGVRAVTQRLHLDIASGPAGTGLAALTTRDLRDGDPFTATDWPRSVVLVPVDRDPNRVYAIEVTALDDRGRAVASVRAFSGYVTGTTRVLRLWLRDSCIGVVCDPASTCDRGRCVMVDYVDPTTLPLRDDDAGIADAGDGGMDAAIDARIPDVGLPDSPVPDAWLPDAHRCTAAECDDGNPCTDDVCDAASGMCTRTNNTASCDDGMFCNGLDACSGGTCVHAGNPCVGSTTCSERTTSCTGCANDSECPAAMMGAWTTCGGFASECTTMGTQSRTVRAFHCVMGSCTPTDMTQMQACMRATEGVVCGSGTSCTAYTPCAGYPAGCAGGTGTMTRTCTDHVCRSEVCAAEMRPEMAACFGRPADGTTCDDLDPCTSPDRCASGTCTGPLVCTMDAGTDAGTTDAGTTDAGPTDAGTDAGGTVCDDGFLCTLDIPLGDGGCRSMPMDSLCPIVPCNTASCLPGVGGADANGCIYTPGACPESGASLDAGTSTAPCSANPSLCIDAIMCNIDQCLPGDAGADANGCVHFTGACMDGGGTG